MACPVTGMRASEVPLTIDAHNEKTTSPAGSIETTQQSLRESGDRPPTYGLDTDNFNCDFLDPKFVPAEMQKVVQEAILLGGGGVAVLLQMALPGVGAGVNRHSNFAYRVEDRLRTTMTFVYCMAFGTPEEKRAIINMVHEAHSVVKGQGYSADDADLQLWVAATLYACATDIYEKVFGKLDETTADRVYEQYGVLASSLRVSPEMWPKTRADFWEYWEQMIASELRITDDAMAVKKDLLYNKKMPFFLRMQMPVVRVVTAEWMPVSLREPFGWKKHSKRRRVGYFFINALVQGIYPNMPLKLRRYPVEFYLKDMRKRMMEQDRIIGQTKQIAVKA